MAQVTLSTEDALLLASYVINAEHDFPELGSEQDYVATLAKELKEQAELSEERELAASKSPAPKPHNVKGGWVMGTVSTGYVGSTREFPICNLQSWEECTEAEAGEMFQEALWDNIDAGY